MQNNDGKNLIIDVEEKPKKPKSNLAILPLYIFEPKIFDALKNTSRGHSGELQVTDAIKTLINLNESVIGFNYGTKRWYDIGSPDNYFKSLSYSYKKSK
jgi:UTP--glucose-1-phosphate uridylyltransferase